MYIVLDLDQLKLSMRNLFPFVFVFFCLISHATSVSFSIILDVYIAHIYIRYVYRNTFIYKLADPNVVFNAENPLFSSNCIS